jgi:molybdopterin/thiamine biosynthesis adenylyltransferase
MYGQVTAVIPGRTPCLNCFLNDTDRGICPSVGAAVSLIASVQAAEILKIITGTGETLAGKLFTADLVENTYRIIPINARNGCGVCNVLIR